MHNVRIPEAVLEQCISADDSVVSKIRTSVEKFNSKWGPTLAGTDGNQTQRTTARQNSQQAIADASPPARVLGGPQFSDGEEPFQVGGAFEFPEDCIMQRDEVTEFFGLNKMMNFMNLKHSFHSVTQIDVVTE